MDLYYLAAYLILNYENKLLESVNNESEIHTESGIDYWIFTRNTYKNNIPPFLIGKWLFDGCLIHIALKTNKLTIDATNEIQIIHQDVRNLTCFWPLSRQAAGSTAIFLRLSPSLDRLNY